jgi:phenylpropionate dioxygenase-like ring-hydroxylating dioxygenase large terminal subunit
MHGREVDMDDRALDIAGMIDDRPSDKIFSVDRRIFTDARIYELEMTRIFERTWVFVGLDSQMPQPHDFITGYIGRQPILLMRDKDGVIGCFLNTCRHRGTIVCPFKQGQRKLHVCRYHGWTYDSGGRNVAMTEVTNGQYPPDFAGTDHDLVKVARLDNYRGFLFASLSANVPPLAEHLGDTRVFLDLIVDQSPVGQVEFVPGATAYTFDANWKLQFENGLDYYHFASTHSSYVDILKRRPPTAASSAGLTLEPDADEEGQGSFSFDYGHAVNWSIKHKQLYGRPLAGDVTALAALRQRVGETRVKWMLRQRNLTIFPNLQVIDILSAQVRTWRPLAADKTEMTSHCLAPVGESAEARRLRIRNYEDFFNATGLASSDDNIIYEFGQAGYDAVAAGRTQGYLRGIAGPPANRSEHACELGLQTVEGSFGGLAFGGETNFHAGYREWRRLMRDDGADAAE